jgi:glycosyltransferase involved in cell wall biosynthesis
MPDTSDTSRPLRILHLTAGSDAGGLSRYIFELSSVMQRHGHQVAVAGERGAWHWLFEPAPFPWIDAPMKGGLLSLRKSARLLSKWIDQHPVDLLHVHYRKCSMVGRQIQKIHHIPILYTLHLSDLRVGWPWNYFTDFGDHTHAASVEARDWLVQTAKVPAENISVIPHGVDPGHFRVPTEAEKIAARAASGLEPSDLIAIFVGRLDAPKNEEWMLDVAAQSCDRIPNLKVLIVGEGPHEESLRRRITAMSLESRVRLMGHRDSLPMYHAADALLLPSLREGFSLVCAEAMCTGLPVLRTRTAGTRELVVENVTGRSVPINHDAFVAAAIDFLADAKPLKRMGTAAAEHIRSNFTFERQLEATLEMYRAVIVSKK